jgi:hypothetical protein
MTVNATHAANRYSQVADGLIGSSGRGTGGSLRGGGTSEARRGDAARLTQAGVVPVGTAPRAPGPPRRGTAPRHRAEPAPSAPRLGARPGRRVAPRRAAPSSSPAAVPSPPAGPRPARRAPVVRSGRRRGCRCRRGRRTSLPWWRTAASPHPRTGTMGTPSALRHPDRTGAERQQVQGGGDGLLGCDRDEVTGPRALRRPRRRRRPAPSPSVDRPGPPRPTVRATRSTARPRSRAWRGTGRALELQDRRPREHDEVEVGVVVEGEDGTAGARDVLEPLDPDPPPAHAHERDHQGGDHAPLPGQTLALHGARR